MDDITNIEKNDIWVCQDSDELDLEVKESQIKGAGKGLFAKRDFEEDEILIEYRGKVMRTKYCYDKLFDYEDRMVRVNAEYCIIGNNIAQYANDIVIFDLPKYGTKLYQKWVEQQTFPTHFGFDRNADITPINNKAFLKALRKINKGEEIFVDYGFAYWEFFYKIYSTKK